MVTMATTNIHNFLLFDMLRERTKEKLLDFTMALRNERFSFGLIINNTQRQSITFAFERHPHPEPSKQINNNHMHALE